MGGPIGRALVGRLDENGRRKRLPYLFARSEQISRIPGDSQTVKALRLATVPAFRVGVFVSRLLRHPTPLVSPACPIVVAPEQKAAR